MRRTGVCVSGHRPHHFGHTLVNSEGPHKHRQRSGGDLRQIFHVVRGSELPPNAHRRRCVQSSSADGTCGGRWVKHAISMCSPSTDDSFHWNWRQLKYESDEARGETCGKDAQSLQAESGAGIPKNNRREPADGSYKRKRLREGNSISIPESFVMTDSENASAQFHAEAGSQFRPDFSWASMTS